MQGELRGSWQQWRGTRAASYLVWQMFSSINVCLTFVQALSLWAESGEISSDNPSYLLVQSKSFKEVPSFFLNSLFASDHTFPVWYSFNIHSSDGQQWNGSRGLIRFACLAGERQVISASPPAGPQSCRLLFELAVLLLCDVHTDPAAACPCCPDSVRTPLALRG